MPILAIVQYHCEIAGEETNSLDFQVRYFDTDSEEELLQQLKTENDRSYKNPDGEIVDWIFDQIISIEHDPKFEDGEELIGFITEK